MRLLISGVLTICLASPIGAQTKTDGKEVLTNDHVVQMTIGKVPRDLVKLKIQSASNTFDVTPEGLVRLNVAKVSPEVIGAVLQAGAPNAVLTNDGVIHMVANKLPQGLILAKINVSQPSFDLTSTGLVSLTANKVADKVVKAMIAAEAAPKASVPSPPGSVGARPERPVAPPPVAPPGKPSPPLVSLAKISDGEAVVIHTKLGVAAALAKVKSHFNTKNIDFTVNTETNRLISDWFNERGCGPGFQKCANRANVRVTSEGGGTVVVVQVYERKREAGLSSKPWNENAKSKGKETTALAAMLSDSLR